MAAFEARGVTRIFGIPGGGSSLDLIDAAGRRGIDFVLTRGETAAAIMAAVTAELTGAPGVVLTGIGPGAASVVNGIAYASLERAPVVAITDAREPDAGTAPHQVFDQQALFAPITKASRRLTPEDGAQVVEELLDRALAQPPGPVHVDLSASDAGSPVVVTAGVGVAVAVAAPAADPNPGAVEGEIEAARGLLSQSRRPVVVAGIEARAGGAGRALRRLVETLGCPAMTTYKAKGVIADDHPQTIGHFTGARSEAEALARTESQADLIVFVGVDPVELIAAPWFLEAPVLALSAHPAGPAFPVAPAAGLHGPLGLCVEAVAEAAVESDWTEAELGALKRRLRDRLRLDGKGHTAETVVAAAAALAAGLSPGRARATVDAGAHMFSTMAEWRAAAPYDVLKSTGLSTMGFALPAAIAAALAEPARPVIAFTGDGGLLMCLAELSTAARLGCNLTVVVFNDAALALIDVKQQRQQRPPSGVRYPAVDFAAAARGLGCQAWKVGPDDPLEPALRAAFAHPGPALVDVTIDPSGYGAQLAALRG